VPGFLGMPAAGVEIHPGDSRNSFEDLAMSIRYLLTEYGKAFGVEPLVRAL